MTEFFYQAIVMDPDAAWITEFDEKDALYKDFYKEDVAVVSVYSLYVNRENELFHSKREVIEIDSGVLPKSKLVSVLQQGKTHGGKQYRPIALLKYNMDVEPEDVKEYMADPSEFDFMTMETNIRDIHWADTISLFHSMNSLHVIFHEIWSSGHHQTRKIYIRNGKLKRRKTRRKQLKASAA